MKAICRTFGIPKWPYTHKGKKRRLGSHLEQVHADNDQPLLFSDPLFSESRNCI